MRFSPSEALADQALELQLTEFVLEKDNELNRQKILPGIKTLLKQKEDIQVTIQVVRDAVRERLSSSIIILASRKKNEPGSIIIWDDGEFISEVRDLLADLLGIDPESENFQTFAKNLAEEFGEWSETDSEGMKLIRLARQNGQVVSQRGSLHRGTKMRHKE